MKLLFNYITGLVIFAAFFACRKKSDNDPGNNCTYVPVYVDTVINITDIKLLPLRTTGYVYLKGGYRGIVVFKVSDTEYKAFERTSTFKMGEVGCQLKVDMASFCMRDTCSGSRFDFNGNVIQEPANCPLLQYNTTFIDGERIRIFHSI